MCTYQAADRSAFLEQSWKVVCFNLLFLSLHALHSKICGADNSLHVVCSLIKDELEPHMRDFSPSVVNGLYFERLSFGLVPMSIMGVRIVPQSHSGQNVAIGATALPDNVCCKLQSQQPQDELAWQMQHLLRWPELSCMQG